MEHKAAPAPETARIAPHGIFVRYVDEKRGAWFTPRKTTNRLRVYAAIARTEAEVEEFHRIADEIRGRFGVALFEVRKLWEGPHPWQPPTRPTPLSPAKPSTARSRRTPARSASSPSACRPADAHRRADLRPGP